MKKDIDIFSYLFQKNINKCISESTFLDDVKSGDAVPIFKSNYRPVRILWNVFKIFEICIYDQLINRFDQMFSKYYFGFRKGYV